MRLAPAVLSLSLAIIGLGLVAPPVQADPDPHQRLKEHVRDMVQDVKAAPTAAWKRAILDEASAP